MAADAKRPVDGDDRALLELSDAGGARRSEDTENTPIPQRPTYIIELRPGPRVHGILALRALLKLALRSYGLRCTSVALRETDR